MKSLQEIQAANAAAADGDVQKVIARYNELVARLGYALCYQLPTDAGPNQIAAARNCIPLFEARLVERIPASDYELQPPTTLGEWYEEHPTE